LPRRLSPSAIAAYSLCPRKVFFSHLVRAPRREKTAIPLVIGNAIHEALEKFFGLDPTQRDLARLATCLRSVWRRHAPVGTFAGTDEERRSAERRSRYWSASASASIAAPCP